MLGNDFAAWHRAGEVLGIISGGQQVTSLDHAWALLRSPLPLVDSTGEPRARRLFSAIRQDLGLLNGEMQTSRPLADLSEDTREIMEDELHRHVTGATFFQRENPLVRHVVLRKRVSLENAGLLSRVGVDLHPDRQLMRDPQSFDVLFEAEALRQVGLLHSLEGGACRAAPAGAHHRADRADAAIRCRLSRASGSAPPRPT